MEERDDHSVPLTGMALRRPEGGSLAIGLRFAGPRSGRRTRLEIHAGGGGDRPPEAPDGSPDSSDSSDS